MQLTFLMHLSFLLHLQTGIEDSSTFKLTVDGIVDLANAWTAKNNYTVNNLPNHQKY
jgi:hypothetical protein